MKSKFNLSCYRNLTCDMGYFVPCLCHHVLPGDVMQHHTDLMIRVSPLLGPVMHPVKVRMHHFFVPYRLIWDDWEDFITGGDDGNDASVFPQITITPGEGDLGDYLGLPIDESITVSALPFRAYALVWNEYVKDNDLDTDLTIDTTSGADSTTNTTLRRVRWEKDFYTTCRESEQKGDDVLLPLGSSAPIFTQAEDEENVGIMNPDLHSTNIFTIQANATNQMVQLEEGTAGTADQLMRADLTNATAASVSDVLKAFAEQRFKVARSKYGNKYHNYLNWLGVTAQDSRLQRPEYLGGGQSTISFSEVIQQGTDYDSNDGVGTLRGHGISSLRSNRYKKFFPEHGMVLSMLSVKPKTMYTQGIDHEWLKTTKEEFFQREYEHVGMREVENQEVYAAHTSPTSTFGWQDRYDEYRQNPNRCAGEFHSTLDQLHMARIFSGDPSLNPTFVEANPTNRIYSSTATHQLQIMAYHSMQARRILSRRARP